MLKMETEQDRTPRTREETLFHIQRCVDSQAEGGKPYVELRPETAQLLVALAMESLLLREDQIPSPRAEALV